MSGYHLMVWEYFTVPSPLTNLTRTALAWMIDTEKFGQLVALDKLFIGDTPVYVHHMHIMVYWY